MTTNHPSRERLWSALLQHCRNAELPLACVIALLAEVRHRCDRNDEHHDALDHVAHELYAADIVASSRRRVVGPFEAPVGSPRRSEP
jgi:hypothetical protein